MKVCPFCAFLSAQESAVVDKAYKGLEQQQDNNYGTEDCMRVVMKLDCTNQYTT